MTPKTKTHSFSSIRPIVLVVCIVSTFFCPLTAGVTMSQLFYVLMPLDHRSSSSSILDRQGVLSQKFLSKKKNESVLLK